MRFLLEAPDQLGLGVLRRHPRHLLQAAALLGEQPIELFLARLHGLLAAPEVACSAADIAVPLLHGLGAPLERTLALADAPLLRLHAAAARPKLQLGRFAQLDQLLLAGEHRRLAKRFRLALRLLDDAPRDVVGGCLGRALALQFGLLSLCDATAACDKENCRQGDHEYAKHGNECHLVHIGSMLHRARAGEGKPPLFPRSADRRATLDDAPT
jgi:hypothetical protein